MAQPTPPVSTRSVRADTARHLLAVAQTTFDRKGFDVTVREIARAAGVGVGTLYRAYPTKDALLEAVIVANLDAFAAHATRLTEAGDDALFELLRWVAERCEGSLAARQSLTAPASAALTRPIGTLLTRARAAGLVRDDIEAVDVLALLASTCNATSLGAPHVPSPRQLVSVLCDGLRPPQLKANFSVARVDEVNVRISLPEAPL